MLKEEKSQYCDYRLLDNGVHQLVFLSTNRKTVDEMLKCLTTMVETDPDAPYIRCLIDNSQVGTLPLKYMFQQTRQWSKSNPNRPRAKIASLFDVRLFMGVIETFVATMSRGDRIKFFHPNDRDKAIEWLVGVD